MRSKLFLLTIFAASIVMISCDSDDDSSCTANACSGNVAQICENGQIREQTCPMGCLNGRCLGSNCEEGQMLCNGSIPQKCINGIWYSQPKCADDLVCVHGMCQPKSSEIQCYEGALQCLNTSTPQKCISSQWVDQPQCAAGSMCFRGKCEKLGTQNCTNGSLKCADDGLTPLKCENSGWVAQTACANRQTCLEGVCVDPPKCGGIDCNENETCKGTVCVPNSQLTTPDGTKCDPNTWVDYCLDDKTPISCATQTGVYRDKCETSCIVSDMTIAMGGEYWHPAFCDSDKSVRCTENDIYSETYYCFTKKTEFGKSSFESSYQCAPKNGGGYFALDYQDYFEPVACPGGCDNETNRCKEGCAGNTLTYRDDKNITKTLDCVTELEAVCRQFESVGYSDCFDESDECSTLNETRVSCQNNNGRGTLITKTCLKADNEPNGKYYLIKTNETICPAACNTEKTDCAPAPTN